MLWTEDLLDRLQQQAIGGYHREKLAATEPTALAVLALVGHGRLEAAKKGAIWLCTCQAMSGSVGIRAGEDQPRWPTSLAVMAWSALQRAEPNDAMSEKLQLHVEMGLNWLVSFRGVAWKKQDPDMGHDTTLTAWPWVEGTHSWIEPTAFCTLALKIARDVGEPQLREAVHARTREAVRCLIDRQLASGGCNYGNTTVLGQELRPHVQPTGLAMLALAGEKDERQKNEQGKIEGSLQYLERTLNESTTTSSLSFGCMGLAAHNRLPEQAGAWLEKCFERTAKRDPATYAFALLALAALGQRSPLISLANRSSPEGVPSP